MSEPDLLDLGAAERAVLTGPAWLARAAAAAVADAERRWLLRRPRAVRRSFADEVLAAGGGTRTAMERWLLLAGDEVRASYVREVLEARGPA